MRSTKFVSVSIIWLTLAFLAPAGCVVGFLTLPLAHNGRRPTLSPRQSTKLGVSNIPTGRRSILQSLFCSTILVRSTFAGAQDAPPPPTATKPYATLEALLPAARVKMVIDKSVNVASDLITVGNDSNKDMFVQELQDLLLKPQNYTRSSTLLAAVPQRPAKQYLDTYKNNIDRLNILEKPGGLLVRSGEIDTWKRLKRQERARESNDEIRAALNTYTTNLSFSGNSYRLNVPREQRSRMIRDDALPDVKNVIASDMGMRYLCIEMRS